MASIIRVLIVDDSAFVRKVVREMLGRSPFLEVVGAARDGEEALAMAAELKPDVVTCDLVMPRMDGVEFVRRQMALKPLPILMLTASPQDGERAMQAIDAGAVDFIQKPTALATNELLAVRDDLVEKVKSAVRAPAELLHHLTESPKPRINPSRKGSIDMVVIGVSTGGPQALRYLIPQFPRDFPVPIVMVLHMPVGYTEMFAEKLNDISELEVRETKDGDLIEAGSAYLAQAGRHLLLKKTAAGNVVASLSSLPADKPHRPSVDVLFQSAAEVCQSRLLALVLTGMGDDGKQGAAWVKAQGGAVITEAEESCVIYGMPRSVVESGLSDGSYPLGSMAAEIARRV
jgi:two-component system chemotaxis response regulator CheB